jgi:hypothetical protein
MSERKTEQSERVEDLAETSDDILENVERLRGLEKERRRETISTPHFHQLAGEIEVVSKAIFRSTVRETTLADTIDTTETTIEDVSPRDGE